jgi:hypothetical protein
VLCLHAQCLLQMSTDGQDRTYPTEQRTTRMLASPCVGASSTGGELARSERNVRAAPSARAQAPA